MIPHLFEKGYISVNEVITSVNLVSSTNVITFEDFIICKPLPQLPTVGGLVMYKCTIPTGE